MQGFFQDQVTCFRKQEQKPDRAFLCQNRSFMIEYPLPDPLVQAPQTISKNKQGEQIYETIGRIY